jgi:hypothetical protein
MDSASSEVDRRAVENASLTYELGMKSAEKSYSKLLATKLHPWHTILSNYLVSLSDYPSKIS